MNLNIPIFCHCSYPSHNPFGMLMPGRNGSQDQYRYGFNGQEKNDEIAGAGNSYTAEYWQYDSRLGRRWNIDPKGVSFISSYTCFANNPIINVDVLGDTTYRFDRKTGKYIGMTDLDKPGSVGMIVKVTKIQFEIFGEKFNIEKAENVASFSFADPINDSKAIRDGKITRVVFPSNKQIHKALKKSGAYNKENQGIITGTEYLNNHSNYAQNDGATDFLSTSGEIFSGNRGMIAGDRLYLTYSLKDGLVAHNNYNFGNFLCGAAASALGVPEKLAKAGAHVNNIFNDVNNQGKPMEERQLDSADDQKSIGAGFNWQRENKEPEKEN